MHDLYFTSMSLKTMSMGVAFELMHLCGKQTCYKIRAVMCLLLDVTDLTVHIQTTLYFIVITGSGGDGVSLLTNKRRNLLS